MIPKACFCSTRDLGQQACLQACLQTIKGRPFRAAAAGIDALLRERVAVRIRLRGSGCLGEGGGLGEAAVCATDVGGRHPSTAQTPSKHVSRMQRIST